MKKMLTIGLSLLALASTATPVLSVESSELRDFTYEPQLSTNVSQPSKLNPQQNGVQVSEPGFKVFQFPRTQIPRIDGDFSDWDIVPDSYSVGIDEMWDDTGKHQGTDRSTLDVKVKVGWVNGLNRLYFLYEA